MTSIKGLVITDINQDTYADLVVANDAAPELDIYGGDGTGNFASSAIAFPLMCTPSGLGTADFDRANGPDLVVLCSSYPAALAVIYNDGTGSSNRNIVVPTPGALTDVAIRDMSSDGYPDILTLSQNANTVSLAINAGLAGNGNDFFGSNYVYLDPNSVGAALADFNTDGIVDAVVGNSNSAAVRVRSGLLNGTLGLSQPFSTNGQPQSVCVADVDSDGDQDIIAGDYSGNDVAVQRNITVRGANTDNFVPGTTSMGSNVTAVAVGDINNDGKPDLVVGTSTGVAISVGTGGAAFAAPSAYTSAANAPTSGVAVADLNNDGWPDVVATSATGNSVTVWLNNGSGTLVISDTPSLQSGPTGVAVGDVNLDGKLDVVIALGSGNTLQIAVGINQYSNTSGGHVLNNFTTVSTNLQPSGGVMAKELVLADVNQDGRLDALVPSLRDFGLVVFTGLGDNTYFFAPSTSYPSLGSALRSVAAGDMNHDGRPDLLLVDDSDAEMSMALGR